MREEPSLREKIATLMNPAEVEGARFQIETDGYLTPEIDNLLKMRAEDLRRKGLK